MSEEQEPLFVGAVDAVEGWLAVTFTTAGFDHARVFDGIGSIWGAYEEVAERVLVDVPVGLIEEGDAGRPCDEAARRVLGPRASAIVTPPVREAARKRRFPAAKRATERKTGHDLSKRAFAMSDAIVAVDELVQEVAEARTVLAEAHPEVCFRAFAGTTLEHEPTTAAGYAERMRALATFDRDAAPVVQQSAESTAGHDVGVHDVLDAVALAYTARPGPGDLRSLPADPPTDASGLPMRMVYRAEQPLVPAAELDDES
jgi:predicted RNase H-like nuclease